MNLKIHLKNENARILVGIFRILMKYFANIKSVGRIIFELNLFTYNPMKN